MDPLLFVVVVPSTLVEDSRPAMAEPAARSTPSKATVKVDSSSSRSSTSHPIASPTDPSHSTRCSSRSGGSIQSQHIDFGSKISEDQIGTPTAHPPVLMCGCKEPACTITSATANNPGRNFLKCRKRIQAVNCTCYRGLKGCYLWVWEDRLKEYVKRKSEWNQEQAINNFMQEAAHKMALKDQEIRRIRSEFNSCIQVGRISTSNFQLQVKKINWSRMIYMFLVVVMFAWICASRI